MAKPLKLLLLEDSEDDEELCLLELRRCGYAVTHLRVQTAEAMRDALAREPWDLIISDYSMPEFSAPAALALLHETKLDLPFIIVSGTIGEETAVDALKAGAQDFLVKGRLGRLSPVIERELRDARDRRTGEEARRAAEEALREKARAEAATQAKSRFLADMSHELRTPLNAIIGFCELLEQELAGPLTAQQKRYLANVLLSGRMLLRLVSDILDTAKVEAGRLEIVPEPTSLQEVAAETRLLLEPLADKRQVKLTVAIPDDLPDLSVDPVRLRQILHNLLSNGIKYSAAGGTVRLEARAVDDRAEIAVSDTGAGIRPEDLTRLFRDFEQLAPTGSARSTGTGLGLALTKKLLELHGGGIAATSEVGRGSTFTAVLPVCRPTPAKDAPPPAAASEARAPESVAVLVVEDDPPSRELVHAVLEGHGCEVLDAGTIEEALRLLARRLPRIVITDIRLPDGGGRQLLTAIREDPALARLPVVASTAYATEQDRAELLAAGFDAYVSKPLDLQELLRIIDTLAAGH